MNFIDVRLDGVESGTARLVLPGGAPLALPLDGPVPATGALTLGVRPEQVRAHAEDGVVLLGQVRLAERLGGETMLYVEGPDGAELAVQADGLDRTRVGEVIRLGLDPRCCHLFAEDGRAIRNGSLL